MTLAKTLKRIEDKYPWSFLGVFLAVVLFAATLYLTFREISPDIKFEITNEANILDVRKPLKDLAISFRGEDIQKKKINLRILTIRIENVGEVDILQSHYEAEDIWGFEVPNAKIIEARLVNSNSDYLKSKLNPHLARENVVQFKKVIFEKGRYFILEVLVLHPKDSPPEIRPLGKIAGIERTVPVKSWLEKGKKTFLEELFSGGLIVQILRPIIYVAGAILVLIVVAFFGDKISRWRIKRKKELHKKDIETLLKLKPAEEGSKRKIAYDIYLEEGPIGVRRLEKTLEDQDRLRGVIKVSEVEKEYAPAIAGKERETLAHEDIEYLVSTAEGMPRFLHRRMKIHDLIEKGVLSIGQGDKVEIDTEFKKAFEDILNVIEQKEKG